MATESPAQSSLQYHSVVFHIINNYIKWQVSQAKFKHSDSLWFFLPQNYAIQKGIHGNSRKPCLQKLVILKFET